MSDANLMSAMSANKGFSRAVLSNLVLFGRVRCLIEKPTFLTGLKAGDGFFAILDTYAIKCLGVDYFGDGSNSFYDAHHVYFTRGSCLIFVEGPEWVGKDVKVYGRTSGKGVNIRIQDGAGSNAGISAFAFMPNPEYVGGKNVFTIAPNKLIQLGTNDPDARGTQLQDFMLKVVANSGKEIPYPKSLDTIVPYYAANEYTELGVNAVGGVSGEESSKSSYQMTSGDRIDVSKIDMKLEYHLSGAERSEFYGAMQEEVANLQTSRAAYAQGELDSLRWRRPMNYERETGMLEDFIHGIVEKSGELLGGTKVRHRDIVKRFVESLKDLDIKSSCLKREESEGTIEDDVLNSAVEMLKNTVEADPEVLYGRTGTDIDLIPALDNTVGMQVGIVSAVSGIGLEKFLSSWGYCDRYTELGPEIWFFMVMNFPYFMSMFSPGLNTVDCDILFNSIFNKYSPRDNREDLKAVNMLHRKFLALAEAIESAAKEQTYVEIERVRGLKSVYPTVAKRYVQLHAFPSKPENMYALEDLCGLGVELGPTFMGMLDNGRVYSKDIFMSMCDMGMLNVINDKFVALGREVEQEFMIYDVLERKGKQETGINDWQIDLAIKKYEESHGFQLENLQKEAVKLCKFRAGVLSGCAGSGKTTTSEVMTDVLKNLDGYELVYCTPTGKACRRLAEVVHHTVRTIHSQFRVGLGGSAYLFGVMKAKAPGTKRIYIFDEMAMCSTELMFHVARNIGEGDICYFLGDVKQLPPIGKGCPFRVLMTLLPCVELGVSKRAAAGSLVNYNTSLINFMSSGSNCPELTYDDSTFMLKECGDKEIPAIVRNTFAGFVNGTINGQKYGEDDIQVITGYQKPEITFSVGNLNPMLQELLRKKDRLAFVIPNSSRKYYINDRVIHLKNDYSMCRYLRKDRNHFKELATFGVVNGEVGKIVDVLPADSVHFEQFGKSDMDTMGVYTKLGESQLIQMAERREEKEDNLRQDNLVSGSNSFFVVVNVYDTDLEESGVYLMYRATGRYLDGELVLRGEDLGSLDLAYALTTHKMQGSQSKVVILPFGSECNPFFINRNMINTMITRSQGIVYMIGSIQGADSPVNRGRRNVSKTQSHDLLNILVGNHDWLFR